MKLRKKYLSVALIGLVCLPAGCGKGESTQSGTTPAPTTTTLPVDQYPHTDIHFASDISLATQDRVRLTVSAAEGMWGVVESLEMWVVGLNPKAAMALKEDFCKQREETNTPDEYTCASSTDEMSSQFWRFANNSRAINRDRHEYRESPYFSRFEREGGYIMLGFPFGLSGKWYDAVELDQMTIFHEYFHAIQRMYQSHPQAPPNQPDKFDGPDWMTEGLAVYMSEYAVGMLRENGILDRMRLPIYETEVERPSSDVFYASFMAKIDDIGVLKKERPGMTLKNSGSAWESKAPYVFGAWAVAYLSQRSGKETFIDKYYPSIDSLGWKQSFKHAFGVSIKDFYIEFDQFMQQTISRHAKGLSIGAATNL